MSVKIADIPGILPLREEIRYPETMLTGQQEARNNLIEEIGQREVFFPEEEMEKCLSECKAWQALWLEVPAEIMEQAQPLIAKHLSSQLGRLIKVGAK